MGYKTITTALGCAVVLGSAALGGSPSRVVLQAGAWFNYPSLKIPDDRTYILFFFTTFREKEVVPFLEVLNRLHRRQDTVVFGLSPESKAPVDRFVKKAKIRFTVGAMSPSYKAFGIKQVPRIVVWERGPPGNREDPTFTDLERFKRWVTELPEDLKRKCGASGGIEGRVPPFWLRGGAVLNPSDIRREDDRNTVLFFFTTLHQEEMLPFIRKVNDLHKYSDTVVYGLSPNSEAKLDKLVKNEKILFTVFAGSPTHKDLHINRFPQVVVLEPDSDGTYLENTYVDAGLLDRWFPEVPEHSPVVSGAFDKDSPIELLRRHAHEDPSYREQARCVRLLRDKLPAQEFMDFCDEILEYEFRPALRGAVAYQKHLADPDASEKEPLLADSTLAGREIRNNPDDPRWARYGEFFDGIDSRNAESLFQDYLDHLGDDPVDLQIRKAIPREVTRRLREERVEKSVAVHYLKQMLLSETDFVIRQRITGAFSEVCEPGDISVADFLEERLALETNIRVVQPMMEYTIRYLRTGEE